MSTDVHNGISTLAYVYIHTYFQHFNLNSLFAVLQLLTASNCCVRSTSKLEDAADLYQKAGNIYKANKQGKGVPSINV